MKILLVLSLLVVSQIVGCPLPEHHPSADTSTSDEGGGIGGDGGGRNY